ncbi:MAG: acetate kinase [Candidatus Saelkia tenebricola]|nr:acetate kinase [Candidatus Saelkia tenebricola]
MWFLTINSGSSSIKYSLFKVGRRLLLKDKGVVEKIGEEAAVFIKESKRKKIIIRDHLDAIEVILAEIKSEIKEVSSLMAVGHRVVHGGERFKDSVIINTQVLKHIKKCNHLAPLHNPPSILAIEACLKLLKNVPQVAVFDTAFHHTIPIAAYTYALPYDFYRKYKVRRYGFHGTSHNYVAVEAAKILKKPFNKLKLITCHLGNGCSIAAIKNGKSIDTSMGFTPLEGLVMGTRSGDIDPAIIFFLIEKGYSPTEVEELLNRGSGLLGVSGISNDMREIEKEISKGNKRASLAREIFVYRLAKYISSYVGVLGGADAVVFTGGIGENQKRLRSAVEKIIKPLLEKFKTKILVIATDEELMIAKESLKLLKYKSHKEAM